MAPKDWNWSTPTVKILAGSDKQIFYVHPDALSSKSPVWKSRLEGSWKDNTFDIDWTEFDPETVVNVMSFLYTEDYDPTEQVEKCIAQASKEEAQTAGEPAQPTPKNRKKSKRACKKGQQPSRAYINNAILIAHAKVYIFANQFLCDELKTLALSHLAKSLEEMQWTSADLLWNVSETILFVYEETHATTSELEPARESLMNFLARNLTQWDEAGSKLFANHEIMTDLLQKTLQRTSTAEQRVIELSSWNSGSCRGGRSRSRSPTNGDSWF